MLVSSLSSKGDSEAKSSGSDVLRFSSLDNVCNSLVTNIQDLEMQLAQNLPESTDIPSLLEPIDEERMKLRQRLNELQEQQDSLQVRYNTFQSNIVTIREHISQLERKIIINNNHNIRVQIVHNSVDFEALRAHVVSTTLPYPPIKETEFTPQDIEDLLKDIDYNPSLDEPMEVKRDALKDRLARAQYDKKCLQYRVSHSENGPMEGPDAKNANTYISISGQEYVIIKKGWMSKMVVGESTNPKWYSRLVCIEYSLSQEIYYLTWRVKEGCPPVGSIALPWCLVEDANVKENSILLNPQVYSKKWRQYYLSVSSSEELKEWMEAFTKVTMREPSEECLQDMGFTLRPSQ